jgi:hypothetical protein
MQRNRVLIDHSPDNRARYGHPSMSVVERITRNSLSDAEVTQIVEAVQSLPFAQWAIGKMNDPVKPKAPTAAAPVVQRNTNDHTNDDDSEGGDGDDSETDSYSLTAAHAARIHAEADRYSKLGKHRSFAELKSATARSFHRREPSPGEIAAEADKNAKRGRFESYQQIQNRLRNGG